MPELPEVETIKNDLSAYIIGHRFISITVNDSKLIQNPLEDFISGILHQKIISLDRRGKYLIFRLSTGKVLMTHLRMTGSLLINPGRLDKFARVIFELDNHSILAFRDIRRFGTLSLSDNDSELDKKLGIEPLSALFTVRTLSRLLRGRNVPIKAALLDQKIIAGLGNMYADEALFAAMIHPLKKAAVINTKEVSRLHRAITSVIREAISYGGASVDTYFRPDGNKGKAHDNFKVAHRRNEKCTVCNTSLQRIVVQQRGTYFCPECQKL